MSGLEADLLDELEAYHWAVADHVYAPGERVLLTGLPPHDGWGPIERRSRAIASILDPRHDVVVRISRRGQVVLRGAWRWKRCGQVGPIGSDREWVASDGWRLHPLDEPAWIALVERARALRGEGGEP